MFLVTSRLYVNFCSNNTSEWRNFLRAHNLNNTNTVNMGTLFLLQGPRIWMDNWINTHLPCVM